MAVHEFDAVLYLWDVSGGAWVFLNLPEEVGDEIDDGSREPRPGFGSVRVEVSVGSSTWRTSVFPSKQEATYVLPVKKAVRRTEGLEVGDVARVVLRVLD